MYKDNQQSVRAFITGLSTTYVTEEEKEFIAQYNPYGFILFSRNIDTPSQVKTLTQELRTVTKRDYVPILIDQEGGRVARLTSPQFEDTPPQGMFADLAEINLEAAKDAVRLNTLLIANELLSLGINVNCAPVVDILYTHSHDIVGDRSFGSDPHIVSELANIACQTYLENGIIPIMKHIPGHGRATVDSHVDLPVISAPVSQLASSDFVPFKALRTLCPWAMTAHIIYSAIDKEQPATLSADVVKIIRESIGFEGVLITDDLSMKALSGSFESRTKQAFNAGCDIALHCNGNMEEMTSVASNSPLISDTLHTKLQSFNLLCAPYPTPVNTAPYKERLAQLLSIIPTTQTNHA